MAFVSVIDGEVPPWTKHSLSIQTDDVAKDFNLGYAHSEDEILILFFEREDQWKIAEFAYSSLDGRDGEFALLEAFVDQLIDANVTAGTKWTSIETDRFGKLKINYENEQMNKVGLNFGIIVNEMEYFRLETLSYSSSGFALLKVLDTIHILDIETGFENWKPNETFEIKHCKLIVDETKWVEGTELQIQPKTFSGLVVFLVVAPKTFSGLVVF